MKSSRFMLAIVAVLVAASVGAAESDLIKLCDGNLLAISRLSQAKQILQDNKLSDESSCNQYKDSFAKLEPVLDAVESGNLCQLETVEKIERYHDEFVKKNSFLIPEKLREFFVALSFELSSECKKTAANLFATDSRISVTQDELKTFDSIGSSSSSDSKDVQLVEDIKKMGGKYYNHFELLISTEASKKYRMRMLDCENKFKPFYSKLLVPLIKLSKLGYNRKVQPEEEQILRSWFGAVRVCESIASAEVFEDKANIVGDKKALTFVSAEKAAVLRESQGSLNEEVKRHAQPVEYSPPKSSIAVDEIPFVGNEELEQLAAAKKEKPFDTKRLIKKALKAKFKSALSSGKLRFKSLTSVGCSRKHQKCHAKVSDVTDITMKDLDNLSLQRIKREVDDPSTAEMIVHIVFCIIIFVCAIIIAITLGIAYLTKPPSD